MILYLWLDACKHITHVQCSKTMKLLQNPSFVHRNQVTYNEQNDKHTAVMPHDKNEIFNAITFLQFQVD